MTRGSGEKYLGYLLLLACGVAVGVLTGGEFIRRIYRIPAPAAEQTRVSPRTTAAATQPASLAAAQQQIGDSRETALVQATRAVSQCVVGIVVTQIRVVRPRYHFGEFFQLFGPENYRRVENMGSGVVIREDGLILTNFHVVEGAAVLLVNFPDGRQMSGTIIGVDEQSDLALVRVPATGLQTIRMADSDQLKIGEWVLAIGNPFLHFINDAHPTVTVGVVSALNRNFSSADNVYYGRMIQTDAAINPGNSGGPLVDALGRAIGINTVIYTGSDASKGWIGIGFAIPINRAARVADELLQYGRRRQIYTGVQTTELTRQIALALGYERAGGVVVSAVKENGPGHRAGLTSGDLILRIGDTRIRSVEDLRAAFIDLYVNDKVTLVYQRKRAERATTLILEEFPR